jgi:hypothetical protein
MKPMIHKYLQISWVLLCILLIANHTEAQEKHYKTSCIGFYNLENLFDTLDTPNVNDEEFTPAGIKNWNTAKYATKIENMSQVIAEIGTERVPTGPVVLGLCELENVNVLQDLIASPRLKPLNYGIVHYDSPDKRGVDVALLYQKEAFKVVSSSSHRLVVPNKTDFDTRDQLLVTGLLDGEKFHFIVNHWPSRWGGDAQSSYLREAAAGLSRSIIDSLLTDDPKAKIILMGDLNDNPDNKSVKEILHCNADAKKLEKDELFNATETLFTSGIGSLAYKGKWDLFDQHILSPYLVSKKNKGYRFDSAKIFDKPFVLENEGKYAGYPKRSFIGNNFKGGYSDHLATYIFLKKPIK